MKRKKIVINTSNLQKGGALQVAASFVEEAAKVEDMDFVVVLGKASSRVIDQNLFKDATNLHFASVDMHPTDSIGAVLGFNKVLKQIEKKWDPDGVITVFGPCYWKPKSTHIMGFANGYLLYEDTYFFTAWQGWKNWKYQLKKRIHRFLLKREASYYWTETEDSRQRLSSFTGKQPEHIAVATNNCSHFFREKRYEKLSKLPPKTVPRLLYISSYYPHKGFELIPPVLEKVKEAGFEVELVITIDKNDFIRIFNGVSNVINLESVEPQYCPYVYQHCDIVFAPTLLETFTAVYPEAMYMQKPIVTTALPFARSICGDAALYFNPASTDEAAKRIEELLTNNDLRDKLTEKGLQQLKKFDLPKDRFRKVLNALLNIPAS